MTGTIRIEPATSADAEAIATIVRGLGQDENVGLPADFDADTARAWLNRLGENGTILLAYEGSIFVAFGAIDYSTVEPNTALLGVWVLPDFRRRGIGTALAEELLEFARERGYKRIRGRLPEGNEPALSFLSSIGAMVPLRNPDMRFDLPL